MCIQVEASADAIVSRIRSVLESEEALRVSVFFSDDGVPVQRVLPVTAIPITLCQPNMFDLLRVGSVRAVSSAVGEVDRPLGMFTVCEDGRVALTLHHLIIDGIGIDLLVDRLMHVGDSVVPSRSFNYLDYSEWDRQAIVELLANDPRRLFVESLVHSKPAMQWRWGPLSVESAAAAIEFQIDPMVVGKLEAIRLGMNVPTLFPVLVLAWMRTLAEFLEPTDEEAVTDVIVLSSYGNRNRVLETENTIGCFVSTPIFRGKYDHGSSGPSAITREGVEGIWKSQELSWIPVKSENGSTTSPVMIEMFESTSASSSTDSREPHDDVSTVTQFELNISLSASNKVTLSASGRYWASVDRLNALVRSFECLFGDLPVPWTHLVGPSVPIQFHTVADMLRWSFAENSSREAISFLHTTLTYRESWEWIYSFYDHCGEDALCHQSVVGVYLDRSLQLPLVMAGDNSQTCKP